MDKLLKRASSSVQHLIAIDEFFAKNPEYLDIRNKLYRLAEIYENFSKELYVGKDGRQMILSDLLTYFLTSRGCLFGFTKKNRGEYLKMILYIINQLLVQEPITTKEMIDFRKDFMKFMKSKNLNYFFENDDFKALYEKAESYSEKDLSYTDETQDLYYAVDSLLPKSIGTVIELVVYIYLIRHNFGYVIPLLLHQRLLSERAYVIAPDFLIIKNGRIFGVEVKQAREGVASHIFTFMSETSIPVIIARVPNTVPLRCPACKQWILYCDNIIERFSDIEQEMKEIKVSCIKCEQFENCKHTIYFGSLSSGETEYHYHYNCVKGNPYVNEILSDGKQREKRLVAYFPYVQGLKSLEG